MAELHVLFKNCFSSISPWLRNTTVGKRTREKLAALDRFLRQKHGLPLYRAVSVSEARFNDVLSGREEADFKLCSKVADYFFHPGGCAA